MIFFCTRLNGGRPFNLLLRLTTTTGRVDGYSSQAVRVILLYVRDTSNTIAPRCRSSLDSPARLGSRIKQAQTPWRTAKR